MLVLIKLALRWVVIDHREDRWDDPLSPPVVCLRRIRPMLRCLVSHRSHFWPWTGPSSGSLVHFASYLLSNLLAQFRLPQTGPDEVVIPCLTRQIPAILVHYSSARVICKDAFAAAAQASLRTVSIPDR